MLGEYFLDQCLIACCSIEVDNQKSKEIFSAIYNILSWYCLELSEDKKKNYLTESSRSQIEFIRMFSAFRHELEYPEIFDFNKFIEGLYGSYNEEFIPLAKNKRKHISDDELECILKFMLDKRKMCDMLHDKINFSTLLENIEVGNFANDDEIVNKWEQQMTTSYNNLMEIKKVESISSAASLNLRVDSYNDVFLRFKEAYNVKERFKTGFNSLRKILPSRGFERRRIYVVGGETGVGKSTMLINFICNNLKSEDISDVEETYLYITAENLIDESLIRFYCCLTGTTQLEAVEKIEKEPGYDLKVRNTIIELLHKKHKNILFYYVQPRRTTLQDIESLISNSKSSNLKAVFIDYLDLIRSGTNTKELHSELGEVTLGLKALAVSYNVAIITATQLNRSGYDVDSTANLTQIGKSIEKAEDSDFILFLQNTKRGQFTYKTNNGLMTVKEIRMTIMKNRNGPVGNVTKLVMQKSLDDQDFFNYQITEEPNIDEKDIISDVIENNKSSTPAIEYGFN